MAAANLNTHIKGHVKIIDRISGEVLLDADNAVHNQNMATAIARGLSNSPNGQVYALALGNGGSSVNSSDQITFQAPNVTVANATLYNQTYSDVVDEQQSSTSPNNSVTYQQSSSDTTSIVITTMTISSGVPDGQDASDATLDSDPDSQYAFDELGLFTADNLLLTHIIFSPILKTANRELVITYTLTISIS